MLYRFMLIGLILCWSVSVNGQEPVDQQMIAKIKMEGFQRSQVMKTLRYLTDVAGPRLTGSPKTSWPTRGSG